MIIRELSYLFLACFYLDRSVLPDTNRAAYSDSFLALMSFEA
nr:MAG TPA: hypothetical protein [Caudoviricetes sp.]